MQGRVVYRCIKTVGREPSWCRLNSEYHKTIATFFFPLREQVNNLRMVVTPCGADRTTSMASFLLENPTDKDRLLPFPW